jgi:hypothetical protein
MVELLKKAQGKPYKDIPQEVVDLEKEITKVKAELSKLMASGASEEKVGEQTVKLSNLEYRLKQLITTHKLS